MKLQQILLQDKVCLYIFFLPFLKKERHFCNFLFLSRPKRPFQCRRANSFVYEMIQFMVGGGGGGGGGGGPNWKLKIYVF